MSYKKKITFEPFPRQIELIEKSFDRHTNVIVYGGAIRGGKTVGGIGDLLLLAKVYPKSKWCIVRKTLQTLKDTTIPSFFKVCPESFISKYSRDTQTVYLTNGSQILFKGENFADDKELNRFRGLEVNGFLLEEMNELQEALFNKALERAGSHFIEKQPKPLIIGTCNPSKGWVKKRVYDAQKAGTLPNNWHYISSKIFDNPFIPSDYLEALKGLPSADYEVFVNGNWELLVKNGQEFYKEFSLEKHICEEVYNPNLPIHISFDENVNPYLPVGVFQVSGKNIYLIDEIAAKNPNNTLSYVCSEIRKKYSGHKAGVYIYGDATSKKSDVKLEKGYNFFKIIETELAMFNPVTRVPSANPSVVMRGMFINSILRNNFGGISFGINRKCEIAIEDFQMIKEAEDGGKAKNVVNENGVSFQRYGHFSDLTDYFICELFKRDFEVFQRGDIVSRYVVGKEAKGDKRF